MKRRAFIAAAGAVAAGGSVVPARAQYVPFQNQQFLPQLTIAVNVTLSGPLQKYGQEIVKGVQAAVDEQNRFNAPISHVWGSRALDDRNDPALAAANANVAASDSTCIAVVGNLTLAMTVAALSHYANMGFAVIVPTVTADVVTARGYHNVYRLPAKDSAAGRLFASVALDQKKGVPALAVAFDGDYGYDVGRGFVDQAKADHHPADLLLFPADKTDPADAARTVSTARRATSFSRAKPRRSGRSSKRSAWAATRETSERATASTTRTRSKSTPSFSTGRSLHP